MKKLAFALSALLAVSTMTAPVAAHDAGSMILAETDESLPSFTIYRPAELGTGQGAAPVVVWGNGACSMNHSPWLPIIRRLVSDGYVVLATGEARGRRGPAQPGEERPRYTDADLERAVDWVVQTNADADLPYGGQLDTDRIALAGNSCGGITSTALASRDDRIASVFILSGSAIGPNAPLEDRQAIIGSIHAPLMYVVGGEEDIAHAAAIADADLLPEGVPTLVVARNSGDHVFVSANPRIVETVAEMAEDWFDGTLRGNTHAIDHLRTDICSTCAPDVWSVVTARNLGGEQ